MSTANDFAVAANGDSIMILNPPRGLIERDKAIRLAAWIVAMTDEDEFNESLMAIKNT